MAQSSRHKASEQRGAGSIPVPSTFLRKVALDMGGGFLCGTPPVSIKSEVSDDLVRSLGQHPSPCDHLLGWSNAPIVAVNRRGEDCTGPRKVQLVPLRRKPGVLGSDGLFG